MIRYTLQSDKMPQMLMYLDQWPKELDAALLPAMNATLKIAYETTYARVPFRTGKARDKLEYEVLGFGRSMTGVLGWKKTKDAPWYTNVLEYGARKHTLAPTGRKKNSGSQKQRARAEEKLNDRLSKGKAITGTHVSVNGNWRTITIHPGVRSYKFLAAGYAAAKPVYEKEMQAAVEQLFNKATMK